MVVGSISTRLYKQSVQQSWSYLAETPRRRCLLQDLWLQQHPFAGHFRSEFKLKRKWKLGQVMNSTRKRKKAFYVQANSKKKVRVICQFTYLSISWTGCIFYCYGGDCCCSGACCCGGACRFGGACCWWRLCVCVCLCARVYAGDSVVFQTHKYRLYDRELPWSPVFFNIQYIQSSTICTLSTCVGVGLLSDILS